MFFFFNLFKKRNKGQQAQRPPLPKGVQPAPRQDQQKLREWLSEPDLMTSGGRNRKHHSSTKNAHA